MFINDYLKITKATSAIVKML